MEVGVHAIVHDLASPCQLDLARSTPVRSPRMSGLMGFAQRFIPVHGFDHEDCPSNLRLRAACGTVLRGLTAAVPFWRSVPPGGTDFKIFARPAGALGGIRVGLPLSTGRSLQARRMDHETAPTACVRFGGYTCPMTTQMRHTTRFAGSAAPVGTVAR